MDPWLLFPFATNNRYGCSLDHDSWCCIYTIRSCSTILPTIAATTTAITRSSGRHEELWSLLCVLFHRGNVLEQTLFNITRVMKGLMGRLLQITHNPPTMDISECYGTPQNKGWKNNCSTWSDIIRNIGVCVYQSYWQSINIKCGVISQSWSRDQRRQSRFVAEMKVARSLAHMRGRPKGSVPE